MNKIKGKQYYKTDKDIHDQLVQKSPRRSAILHHLSNRGLLFSSQEDKRDLAEMVSPWFTGYFDQKFISDELGGGNGRKKYDSTEILLEYNQNEISDMLKDLKKEFGFKITKTKTDLEAVLEYTKADFTKNTLSQNIKKTAEIKFEKTNEGKILIRTNGDENAGHIVSAFKQKIKEKHPSDYDDFVISLSHTTTPSVRTQFFIDIINNIQGYRVVDMKVASISIMDSPESIIDDTEIQKMEGVVKRMVLSGGSVHQSNEFQNLLKKGFYLTKIEWTMESNSATGDKIDLSAEFDDPNSCTGFRYALQRVYSKKENGEYNITGKPPSNIERMTILPKIELSAKQSYLKITQGDNSTSDSINEND